MEVVKYTLLVAVVMSQLIIIIMQYINREINSFLSVFYDCALEAE